MPVKQIIAISAFFLFILLENIFPLFKNRTGRIKHGLKNIAVFAFNSLLMALLFSSLTLIVLRYSSQSEWSLVGLLSIPEPFRSISLFLLFDAWMYVWHRMNHEVKFFWRFHRMHHTDNQMDVSTAVRFHTGELIMSSLIRQLVFLLIGMDVYVLLLHEIVMMPVIYFHHSNWHLPAKLDTILRVLIVTPRMHWVHHSDYQPETDSNYGTIFSIWDRLGRSFRLRPDPENIQYGLDGFEDAKWKTLWGMFKTPLYVPPNLK